MRQHYVEDELAESTDPSPGPSMSPQGVPEHADVRATLDPPPRLCEQGPCRHYHTFGVQMDAATPMAGRLEKNELGQIQLVGAPEPDPVRVETHHYCYPTIGVEFILGALPILSCNRWSPMSSTDAQKDENERQDWLMTLAGEKYRIALDAWRERQKTLAAAENAAIDEAAAELAAAESARLAATTTEPTETGEPTP